MSITWIHHLIGAIHDRRRIDESLACRVGPGDLRSAGTPTVGGVIEQSYFLEHVRTLGLSWVELARGVDALVRAGHLKAKVGPPYGSELTASGAKLVAALARASDK